MATIRQEQDRLGPMAAVGALEKALQEGYDFAKPPRSNADPRPLLEVVTRDAALHGTACIKLAGNEHTVGFERYRFKNPEDPSLRVVFTNITGENCVILDVSTMELRLSTQINSSQQPISTPNLPPRMLKAPGADIVLVHQQDLRKAAKAGCGFVRTRTFTLERAWRREATLLYRPVSDSFLFIDPSSRKPTRLETIPQAPIKDLSQLSGKTAATIARDLDPFIGVGSLDFYKPVEITPTHPLSQEVARIIIDNLYPPSTGSNPV